MTCKDIDRLSPLYLCGELDAPTALAFAEHLKACTACASELEKQTRLDAVLRSGILSERIDSTAIECRIRQEIASERGALSRRWFAVCAVIIAMLLAGALAYRAAVAPYSKRLCIDAAQDHDAEVTRHQHRRWLFDPKAIAVLAHNKGIRGSLVTALAPPGYHLEQGKLCRLDGRAFLHLVYGQGDRKLSIYLLSLDGQPLSRALRTIMSRTLLQRSRLRQ